LDETRKKDVEDNEAQIRAMDTYIQSLTDQPEKGFVGDQLQNWEQKWAHLPKWANSLKHLGTLYDSKISKQKMLEQEQEKKEKKYREELEDLKRKQEEREKIQGLEVAELRKKFEKKKEYSSNLKTMLKDWQNKCTRLEEERKKENEEHTDTDAQLRDLAEYLRMLSERPAEGTVADQIKLWESKRQNKRWKECFEYLKSFHTSTSEHESRLQRDLENYRKQSEELKNQKAKELQERDELLKKYQAEKSQLELQTQDLDRVLQDLKTRNEQLKAHKEEIEEEIKKFQTVSGTKSVEDLQKFFEKKKQYEITLKTKLKDWKKKASESEEIREQEKKTNFRRKASISE